MPHYPITASPLIVCNPEGRMPRSQPNYPKQPFQNRLEREVVNLKEEAEALPHGPEREALLRKARQTETASQVNEWLSSPGLRAPK
jgi:hypothetical protein